MENYLLLLTLDDLTLVLLVTENPLPLLVVVLECDRLTGIILFFIKLT